MSVDDLPSQHTSPASSTLKIMALRRPDTCACGTVLAVGERAAWDQSTRTVRCLRCAQAPTAPTAAAAGAPEESAPAAIRTGVAGGSAQYEFDRRHAKREGRVRAEHPRLGGLILALSDDPQSTRAWQSGAIGERRLGEKLAGLGDTVIALHDRQVPQSRANIDHIVIGPAGVFVIDAKRYQNAKIAARRSGGLFSPAHQQLMVSGRDKTKLADAMQWQVSAVRSALLDSPEYAEIAITAALCFIDAQFPLFGTVDIGDVAVRGLGGITKMVSAEGLLDAEAREHLARHLADRLPAKPAAAGGTAH